MGRVVRVERAACALGLLLAAGAALAAGLGRCPVYPPLPHFDIQRITGTWYEIERSFYLMEMSSSCTELNVTLSDKGNLHITITTVNRWTGFTSTSLGVGIPNWTGAPSFRFKASSRLPYALGRLVPGAGQYHVLRTDYTRFAIVWSCTTISIAHSDYMWVLGREREIDVELRVQIYEQMAALRLDIDRLILSKNYNCTL